MLNHFAVVGMIALYLHLAGASGIMLNLAAGVGDVVATARQMDLVCMRCLLRGLAPPVLERPWRLPLTLADVNLLIHR